MEITVEGDGAVELETEFHVGYEPGADDFKLLVEQPSMPTKSITIQQCKNGEDISSHYIGKYSDTHLQLNTATLSSSARGIVTGESSIYSANNNVGILFKFASTLIPTSVSTMDLQNARIQFGRTSSIITSPTHQLPVIRAAEGPFSVKLTPMTGASQTVMLDFKMSRVEQNNVLLAWENAALFFTSDAKLSLSAVIPTSPWDMHGTPAYYSKLNNVAGGHTWLMKLVGTGGSTHTKNVNGTFVDFPYHHTSPELTTQEEAYLGDKTYNVFLIKWKHEAGGAQVLLKHEKPGSEHPFIRPYVQRTETGCFCNFGDWPTFVNFSIEDDDDVYMVIYNNDTIIRTMVSTTSYPEWVTKDLNIADHGLALYGAYKVYRDQAMQVSSIWYGSDSNSLLQSDTDLQTYAREQLSQDVTIYNTSATFSPNQWNRLAVTLDDSVCNLYINESLHESVSAQLAAGDFKHVGRGSGLTSASGKFRNLYVWNTVKTSDEILTSVPSLSGIVFAWTMDTYEAEIGVTPKATLTYDSDRWTPASLASDFSLTSNIEQTTTDPTQAFTLNWTHPSVLTAHTLSVGVSTQAVPTSTVVGSWRLIPQAGAFTSHNYVSTLARTSEARFTDVHTFGSDNTFSTNFNGDTTIEPFQDGQSPGDRAPVYPYDSSISATWSRDGNSLTVTGKGAYVGLAEAYNDGRFTTFTSVADVFSNAADSITYTIVEESPMQMKLKIYGGRWYTFTFVRVTTVAVGADVTHHVPIVSGSNAQVSLYPTTTGLPTGDAFINQDMIISITASRLGVSSTPVVVAKPLTSLKLFSPFDEYAFSHDQCKLNGHHWIVKQSPANADHAIYDNGEITSWSSTQESIQHPSSGVSQYIMTQAYNVIFLRWVHSRGDTALYNHDTSEVENGSPEISSFVDDVDGTEGFSVKLKAEPPVNVTALQGQQVYVVIYNVTSTSVTILAMVGNNPWQEFTVQGEINGVISGTAGWMNIYSASHVDSVWYGSNESDVVLPKQTLKTLATM